MSPDPLGRGGGQEVSTGKSNGDEKYGDCDATC